MADQRFLYEREGLVNFENLNKYDKGCEAIVLVSLEKSADLVIGFYGDKKVDFAIENDCLKYL